MEYGRKPQAKRSGKMLGQAGIESAFVYLKRGRVLVLTELQQSRP